MTIPADNVETRVLFLVLKRLIDWEKVNNLQHIKNFMMNINE